MAYLPRGPQILGLYIKKIQGYVELDIEENGVT